MLYGDDLYVLGTDYANHKGFNKGEWGTSVGNTWFDGWLTRTWENNTNYEVFGTATGSVAAYELTGIRPAIWVDAEKLLNK